MNKSSHRRRTRSEWQALMTDYRRSGLSQKTYCKQRGLAYSTFTNWLAKLRDDSTERVSDAFIEIPVPQTQAWDMELQIGAHVVLRLRQA